ncbi:glutathione S-transferase [Lentibacter algarum]|uniref:glutathione S-transferase n=1 Tax=Lentibacter algarum TaxID=576131 RepID=UPI001C06C907|nr:glutathione S-transferase [Lentibacter algarum]MBU2980589.1 glutathione S-transferase [Lentibacter algarum]
MSHLPVLWSFRRCPYAMRARLALAASGVPSALREVVLRDKPEAFLQASPSATVPCLQLTEETIDESFEIMQWALARHDPESWLDMPEAGYKLIAECDGPFKTALDRYKYSTRYEGADAVAERTLASAFVIKLDTLLDTQAWLFGATPTLADMAILPFIRQFAHVDQEWFEAQPWPKAIAWLEGFKASPRFKAIMRKYPQWAAGDAQTVFPEIQDAPQQSLSPVE